MSASKDQFETTNTYRYVDSQMISYGPLYRYKKDDASTWAVLRYLLETNFGTCHNHLTFVSGYTMTGRPLLDTEELPHLVLVRRHPMPRGFRQYIPPDLNRRFMIAEAELKTCKQILEESSRSFLEDSENFEYHNRVYSETLARSKKLAETLEDIRDKCGIHASRLKSETRTLAFKDVLVTQTYTFPPSNYVCTTCQAKGLHFRDNCDTDLEKRETELKWGAAKMKSFKNKV